jgi:hypothetical protein
VRCCGAGSMGEEVLPGSVDGGRWMAWVGKYHTTLWVLLFSTRCILGNPPSWLILRARQKPASVKIVAGGSCIKIEPFGAIGLIIFNESS